MKISIVMPIYNSEEFLADSMDSLLEQTLTDFELICVNDGSTDRSLSILEAYAKKDPRIRIITQENAGAGAARNNGLRHATGDYLSILDADDFYAPTMLEQAYNAAITHEADIVTFACDFYNNTTGEFSPCNWSIHRNLLPEQQPFAGTDVPKDIFKLFVGWAWDKLFRRSFVEENKLQFQEQRTTNDMLFVFSAVVKAQRMITLEDTVLVHHRKETGVSLSVTREKSWMCFYQALIALRNQLQEWNLYSRFEQDFVNYSVHFSLWNLNSLAEPTHTKLYHKLQKEWFEALGVTDHGADYFYNQYEYHQYRMIMRLPVSFDKGRQAAIRLKNKFK